MSLTVTPSTLWVSLTVLPSTLRVSLTVLPSSLRVSHMSQYPKVQVDIGGLGLKHSVFGVSFSSCYAQNLQGRHPKKVSP